MNTLATTTDPIASVRPRLRGRLHQAGFVAACLAGAVLVAGADGNRPLGAAVFAASAAAMLGTSALYHRIIWSPRALLRMRRLGHAGIYLLIGGTYTPVGLLTLHGTLQRLVLPVVWSGAAAAILMKLRWVRSPKWLSAVLGIALGGVGVAALPQLAANAGAGAVSYSPPAASPTPPARSSTPGGSPTRSRRCSATTSPSMR